MKRDTFDDLARQFSVTRSRRGALSLLLAGAVAPLVSPAALGAKRGKRQENRPNAPRGNGCDVCDDGCPFRKLQPAIDDAKTGDTIRVCEGTYESGPTVFINKRLTVVGKGADDTSLKGSGAVRTLMIGPSGVVTLRGLTVTGGEERQVPRGGGAGILILDRGKLTLDGCVVEKNEATEGGGIVVSPKSELTLIRSTVSDNKAASIGGGILVRTGGTVTLDARTGITRNKANVWGAGIYLSGDANLVLKSGSLVEKNKARFFGGGIFASRGSSVTLESGSRVTENDAGDRGGGIFNDRATVTIADPVIVTDNDPTNCDGLSETANCIG